MVVRYSTMSYLFEGMYLMKMVNEAYFKSVLKFIVVEE